MPQGLIGQITETTANITIQLTSAGSDRPDNFTVEIAQWNTGSISTGSTRTIVTGLTRTATSTINGGSLTVAPYYEIDGIGPMDYALITTASGDCHTVDTDQVLSTAMSVYNPGANGVTTLSTSSGSPATIRYGVTGPSNGLTLSNRQDIAEFTTLPFGNLGYYTDYSLTGFSIEHVYSKDVNSNTTIYGDFANGPLQIPTIEDGLPNDGQHFIIKGNQISGISTELHGPNVSRYKVTWDLSGNFMYVDFYWEAYFNNV
jgi:hypothetical protein